MVRVHWHAQIAVQALVETLMGSIVRVHVGRGALSRGVRVHGGLIGVHVGRHWWMMVILPLIVKGVTRNLFLFHIGALRCRILVILMWALPWLGQGCFIQA